MAGIDKIYATREQAAGFIEWVDSIGDAVFKKDFAACPGISLKNFMYVQSTDDLRDVRDYVNCFPITNFPEIVDRWLLRQNTLPAFARERIRDQYALDNKDAEDEAEFVNAPLEPVDPRPVGKHAKILSRTGAMLYNYYRWPAIEVDNYYRRRKWQENNFPNDQLYEHYDDYAEQAPDDELGLFNDYWWYCDGTGEWENASFPRIRNLRSGSSSVQILCKSCSLKAILRRIRKAGFPVGTVVHVTDWRYVGDMYVEVTK